MPREPSRTGQLRGPAFRGDDPITNFMDYVDDVCMDNLTPDQSKRMQKQWHAFRDTGDGPAVPIDRRRADEVTTQSGLWG